MLVTYGCEVIEFAHCIKILQCSSFCLISVCLFNLPYENRKVQKLFIITLTSPWNEHTGNLIF